MGRRKRVHRISAESPRAARGPSLSAFRGRDVWASLALAAASAFVYAPVREHAFVNFDDTQYVSENPAVSRGLTWAGVSWAFTTAHAANWHPLAWLSHLLDVSLYGLNAGPHHVTSVLIHTANSLLLFGLFHRMTGAWGRSAVVAALFAVHPLHVESVAWVAERKDVLSTLFGLLTLWAYLAYVRRPRLARYLAVMGLFALGLMAKPMLVTLPFVLLLLDYWPLGRWERRSAGSLILEKLPLVALAIASSILTFVIQQQGGAVKGLDALPLARRAANALVAYVAYIGQTLWPARLAPLYPYPRPLPAWVVAGAGLALIAATAAAVQAARRRPYLAVGWLWYLGTLGPVIGLVQVGSQPMADRYTYVPLIGLFVIVAWGLPELLARSPHRDLALVTAAAIAISACAIAARHQARRWKSSVLLWEHVLRVTGENHRAHHNLGHALSKQGRAAEAVGHYREALRIKPDYAEAHHNLGHALAELGRAHEAIAHYSEALRLEPDYEEAHNNMGIALAGLGRADEAIGHLSEALRLKPGLAVTHNNLGAVLAGLGRIGEATGHFSEAVRIDPEYADARKNLGLALAHQGKVDEAIREFFEALRGDSDEPDVHYNLAVLLARKGRTTEAIHHLEVTLKLGPNHPAARALLDELTGRANRPR